jgi:phage terminase small subunit
MALTPKQEMFCKEYIVDMNGTQAAIRAGYSAKTANEQASDLLAKPNIKQYVQSLMDERSKRTEINADYVLNGIKEATEALKKDSKHSETFKGYELLGKHLKLFTDKTETQLLDKNGKPADAVTEIKIVHVSADK